MKDQKLRIVVEVVTKGVQRGFSAASAAVRGFVSTLSNMASSGRRFIDGLAQSVFFLGKAFGMLRDAVRSVYDRFIGTAGSAARLEVKLRHITGSGAEAARIMEFLDQVAKDTGASFEELARGATLMAVAAKDATGEFDFEKFARLSNMLQAMSAFRPDVPLDRLARGLSTAVQTGNWRSLEMFLDINLRQLIGIADAAEDVAKVPGEIGKVATYIELAAGDVAREALKDIGLLEEALNKAGMSLKLVQDMAELMGVERFNETLQSIARTIGEPLFEVLNEGLSELADWMRENPELVEKLAEALGDLAAVGLEAIIDPLVEGLTSGDFVAAVEKVTKFLELLKEGKVEAAFELVGLEDLQDSFESIIEALGVIADTLLTIAGAEPTKKIVEAISIVAPGGKGYEEIPEAWEKAAAFAPQIVTGIFEAIKKELRIQVDINLNSDLLEGRISQGAEDATIRGYNEMSESFRRRGR